MRSPLAFVFCLPLVLAGCSLSSTGTPSPDQGAAIRGSVYGGQQPISGAHVYLMAANTTGYGGAGIAASSNNLSLSALDPAKVLTSDSVGTYVLTDSNGNFSISGDYACTPNTQVYLYSLGGDPTPGVANNVAGLMAVLGNCPSTGNFLTATVPVTYVVVNEVSTVAAAYAFAGFATDATHVSSSSTALAQIGIQNAFANAANLADLGSGTALATTPNGNGTVPQAEIYALADILASCVNTNGASTGPSTPTACYTLFNNALSAGTSGSVPTDTATAAINIAHHPGANVANLFGLIGSNPPFPTGFALPNDFTMGIQFAGGGLNNPTAIAMDGSGDVWVTNNAHINVITELSSMGIPLPLPTSVGYKGGGLNGILSIAIDSSGNAWIPDNNTTKVSEFSSTGSVVPGAPYSGDNLSFPYAVAIDGNGSAWVTNFGGTPSLTVISSAGSITSGASGYGSDGSLLRPNAIAIDGTNHVWVADVDNSNVIEFNNSGVESSQSPYSGGGIEVPKAIAMDGFGNAWIANYGNPDPSNVAKLSPAGAALSPSTGYTAGGINNPYSIAIDGAENVWTANSGGSSVSELTNGGAAISPSAGYTGANVGQTDGIALDGSGDVWTINPFANTVTEIIGASAPVVTPLATGVANNTLGTRP